MSLAELLALLRVFDRDVQRTLCDADRLRTDRRAGVIQRRHGGVESGSRLADDPVARNPAILEMDLHGR